MIRPRILYPAGYSANFGRGKDRTRRRRKILGSVLDAAKEGYGYGKGTLGRIGSAIDLGTSAAALKLSGAVGKYGLKGLAGLGSANIVSNFAIISVPSWDWDF